MYGLRSPSDPISDFPSALLGVVAGLRRRGQEVEGPEGGGGGRHRRFESDKLHREIFQTRSQILHLTGVERRSIWHGLSFLRFSNKLSRLY